MIESQILEILALGWQFGTFNESWIAALESGKVLYFPRLEFTLSSVWVCFSDQTSHAAMSGQYMMEQTLHLPVARQYYPESSPLAILSRLTGRKLI